ncbi:MAG: 4'-phosphopantetheinyl transferase superfamily protein [candidate division Zixibacteria bacterium]|nr:4'-phosphopantetheinyl transferase superfamily protein [candidate division Zixibacteria bacterium]
MVYGIGIDIVSLDKIRSICCKNIFLLKDNFFSENELRDAGIDESDGELTDEQIGSLASMFAAKEAAVKAIGLPFDVGFDWSDIVVSGKDNVTVETSGKIKKFISQIGIMRLTGSVSVSTAYSMAFIIGESK